MCSRGMGSVVAVHVLSCSVACGISSDPQKDQTFVPCIGHRITREALLIFFFLNSIPKKGNAKECSNYCTIALISHASKVMLKILQAKFSKILFSNMWTVNLQMFKLVLEKAKEPEIKLPTSTGSSKKQENSRNTPISASLTTPKPLTVWITTNCGKFLEILH